MAQLFRPAANRTFAAAIAVALVVAAGLVATGLALARSDRVWGVGVPRPQPVPFSHDHHVGGLGLDCRNCHVSVETAAAAGMPGAHTCMSCHSQVWTAAAVLEPLHASLETGQPILWSRVHRLPAHVHFHHGIHLAKGVACETCHGRVDLMPKTVKTERMSMAWCLDCHRDPEARLRPREAVFAMGWDGPPPDLERALRLVEHYGIRVEQLTDCSICHR